jgi:hypothetical protein
MKHRLVFHWSAVICTILRRDAIDRTCAAAPDETIADHPEMPKKKKAAKKTKKAAAKKKKR